MKRTVLASVLALLALGGAGRARADQDVIASLASFDGTLDVIRTGIALSLYPEMPLVNGDVVHTRDGRATILFDDKTEVRLKAHTRLAISDRRERRDLDVFFGRLWAFVSHQKEKTVAFKTGGTIAAVRGTKLEYFADEQGNVDVGLLEGLLELFYATPGGGGASVMLEPGFKLHVGSQGPSAPASFREGDIAEGGSGGGEPPSSPLSPPVPEALPVVTPPPAPPAPAPTPAPKPAAVEKQGGGGGGEHAQTQGEYALKLVHALGIASALPPNATARDAMDFLANLNLFPCDGVWTEDKVLDLNDLLCIAGYDPNNPNSPLTISQEELIAKILERYGELFWLQARRKQAVSPFAP